MEEEYYTPDLSEIKIGSKVKRAVILYDSKTGDISKNWEDIIIEEEHLKWIEIWIKDNNVKKLK